MGSAVATWTYSCSHYHYLREALATRAFYKYETSGPDLIHGIERYNRLYGRYRLVHPDQSPGTLLGHEQESTQRDRLFRARNQVTDLDVDVLDILMGRWLSFRTRQEEYVEIDTDEVLFSRGLQHKVNGQASNADAIGRGYAPQQREVANRAVCRLLLLWGTVKVLHSHDAPAFDEESRILDLESASWDGDPLDMIVEEAPELRKRHTFRFRPGKIFRRYNLFQRMYQPSRIYGLNYRKYAWEKRLARYLCWQWRIAKNQDSNALTKKVTTLLNSLLLNPDRDRYRLCEEEVVKGINPDYRPSRTPLNYRIRERLEEALDRLCQLGLLQGWEYGERWDPSWSRKRNWGKLWRRSRLTLTFSGELKDAYTSTDRSEDTPSRSTGAPTSDKPISHVLETLLQELELTQQELAEELDISQGYVSAVKNERKSPSPEVKSSILRLADQRDIWG